ncbi:PIG-L deacetylase family protein (plasmid) [Deinococcus radiomollis]|uniref:PIG-L deacetylase family protein n=1 Tax=Deinococcus radiomollis TaxID=468916 RepID=UPI003891FCCB
MQSGAPAHPTRVRRLRRSLLGLTLLGVPLYLVFRVRLSVSPTAALTAGTALLGHRKVLVIVGHPDDLEWYVGGTLRRLADAGAEVQVVVATSGERGPNRTGVTDLPAARMREQRAAGRINGYTRIRFLGLPDRASAKDPRFLPAAEAIYREVRPEALMVFDPALPSLPYLHVDHQGTARAVLGFWRTLGADRPPVYLFQTRRPDVAVDISAVIEIKERALAQHVTQNGGSGAGMRRLFGGRAVGTRYAEYFRMLQ